MSVNLYAELGWLPRARSDFRKQLKLWSSSKAPGDFFKYLAGHSLDIDQLSSLARQVDKAAQAGADLQRFIPYRMAVVSNLTIDHLLPALRATALRHGLLLDLVAAPYGQVMQAATGRLADLRNGHFDAVLCAIDARAFPSSPGLFDESAGPNAAHEAVEWLLQIAEGISSHAGAPCILQTLAVEPDSIFGSLDRRVVGTGRRFAADFNQGLIAALEESRHLLFDVGALAETVGTSEWFDPQLYALAKMSFRQDFVPLYAEHLCRLLAAQKGKSRRCLVLDLDNTLWGGVIGDDGVSGIQLGQGDAVGEAYLALQATALQLRQRGVVLAVSSKNEDAIAREPFREHPEMLLREEHIAIFQANWDNKVENIIAIASELGLGLDTFVFLDDNPMERDLVRRQLPEVAVPELPEDPALFARTLLAGGYFESVHFSKEDRARADDYQAQAKRSLARKAFVDMDAYLASLQMQAHITPFQTDSLKRVAQLVGKSNQFNLTTRRYSETEIAAIAENPAYRTWQIRLTDIFGDNGLIGVVICAVHDNYWEIDTWLMSCRVLGRRVEELVLQAIAADASAEGVDALHGLYIPTQRNMMVENHYSALGFAQLDGGHEVESGVTVWRLGLQDYRAPDLPFVLTRD